jgi:hypothetical protein
MKLLPDGFYTVELPCEAQHVLRLRRQLDGADKVRPTRAR